MALTKVSGEGVGTLSSAVTLSNSAPNLQLKDTDTNRFVDMLYGTRVNTFRNTMASGEDMDTVEPSIVFSFKDDGEIRTAITITPDSQGGGGVSIGEVLTDVCFNIFRTAGDISQIRTGRTTNSNVGMIRFRDGDNNACGQITSNPSTNTTSYNTSSDYRLKENVVDMTGAIDRVKALLPKRFNFKSNADVTVDGFLAHEAQTVVPEAVVGEHNEVDSDGNMVVQMIDNAKLVPLLTASLKESFSKIEALEARVAALEGS